MRLPNFRYGRPRMHPYEVAMSASILFLYGPDMENIVIKFMYVLMIALCTFNLTIFQVYHWSFSYRWRSMVPLWRYGSGMYPYVVGMTTTSSNIKPRRHVNWVRIFLFRRLRCWSKYSLKHILHISNRWRSKILFLNHMKVNTFFHT